MRTTSPKTGAGGGTTNANASTQNHQSNTNNTSVATARTAGGGTNSPSKAVAGGIYSDFDFRFGPTYTAAEPGDSRSATPLGGAPGGARVGSASDREAQRRSQEAYDYVMSHIGPNSFLDFSTPTSSLKSGGRGGRGGNSSVGTAASPQPPLKLTKGYTAAVTGTGRGPRVVAATAAAGSGSGAVASLRSKNSSVVASSTGSSAAAASPSGAMPSSTRARRARPTPLFEGDATPAAAGDYEPSTTTLDPPAFGRAAGVEAVGAHSHVFVATADDRDAAMAAERRDNEMLFAMWAARQAERVQYRRLARVEEYLREPLAADLRGMLTAEEDYWLATLRPGNGGSDVSASVSVNPKLKKSASGRGGDASDTSASPSAATAASPPGAGGGKQQQQHAVTGTTRGVDVPLSKMESLFRATRTLLHRQAAAALHSYHAQRALDKGAEADADAQEAERFRWMHREGPQDDEAAGEEDDGGSSAGAAAAAAARQHAEESEAQFVQMCIESETALARETVENARLVPATVSLPPERILRPVLKLETATGVALLWKVLEQAGRSIAGMGFAVQLLKHYVLPHVYDRFAMFHASLPDVGGLSEQVALLATLPLRADEHGKALMAARQARADAAYLERAVKHLALHSWRHAVVSERRRARGVGAATQAVCRLKDRDRLRAAFAAWRLETREQRHQRYLGGVRAAYQDFLGASEVAREIDGFPLAKEVPALRANRSRLIGMKLAESAAHTHPAPAPSRPGGAATGATDTPAKAKDKKHSSGGSIHREEARDVRSPDELLKSTSPDDGTAPHTMPPSARQTPQLPRYSLLTSTDAGTRSTSLEGSAAPAAASGAGTGGAARASNSVNGGGILSLPRIAGRGSAAAAGPPMDVTVHSPNSNGAGGGGGGGSGSRSPGALSPVPSGAGDGTAFDDMLDKLREMEGVCNSLRGEIAIQNKMMRAVEHERNGLRARNEELQAALLKAVQEKLLFSNLMQEKQMGIEQRDRRIMQLKSRIRAHRNRPWQRSVLRLVGEVCRVSTEIAEAADDRRVRRDMRGDANDDGDDSDATGEGGGDPGTGGGGGIAGGSGVGGSGGDAGLGSGGGAATEGGGVTAAQRAAKDEERLFGQLAPIVLSTTATMPDALTILRDWANACLQDLQSLDDLKGGALSMRFINFSEEARSGVLLSRLLFYLALPRYLERSANSHDIRGPGRGGGGGGASLRGGGDGESLGAGTDGLTSADFAERRRQLLERRNVQLDSPFPVYSDCFGDLLSMRYHARMTLLLGFATELMANQQDFWADVTEHRRQLIFESVAAATGYTLPPPAARVEMQEVVDPHAMACGERTAIVTFVALLYERFSHPFNHKCRSSAEVEKAAILGLLGGKDGMQLAAMLAGRDADEEADDDEADGAAGKKAAGGGDSGALAPLSQRPIEAEIMALLDDEDKSPWQLFKERCVPVFGTAAHPFLLRGNFWPSDAFDSPDLASILGELGSALSRSLELHRWHVLVSCLVPTVTYSGVSRGVFTGPRANPRALMAALEVPADGPGATAGTITSALASMAAGGGGGGGEGGDGGYSYGIDWRPSLTGPTLTRLFAARAQLLMEAVADGRASETLVMAAPVNPRVAALVAEAEWRGANAGHGGIGNNNNNQASLADSLMSSSGQGDGSWRTFSEHAVMLRDRSSLARAFTLVGQDLAKLFLRRAVLSAETALPALDLGGWRLLFQDLALISLDPDDEGIEFPFGIDELTEAFYRAVAAAREECVGGGPGAVFSPFGNNNNNSSYSNNNTFHSNSSMVPFTALEMPTSTAPEMNLTAFVIAFVLLADAHMGVFPAPGALPRRPLPESGVTAGPAYERVLADRGADGAEATTAGGPPEGFLWSGDALAALVFKHVVDSPVSLLRDEPQMVLRRITSGAKTAAVLTQNGTALLFIFNHYGRDVLGSAALEKEDLLRLLRDAMLTSTEISQYLIFELFHHCCVKRTATEEEAAARRRDMDGKARDLRRAAGRAVSIVDPSKRGGGGGGAASVASGQSTERKREVSVLDYSGFTAFLCVLCHFKQPNPLIPLDQRLSVFLRRSLIRPLTVKVDGLTALVNFNTTLPEALQDRDGARGDNDG